MSNRWFLVAVTLIAALALGGCGGTGGNGEDGGSGGGSGMQGFYDGTLRLEGDDTVVVAEHGGQEHELQRGEDLNEGQLRAYEEAETRVRVSYDERDGQEVATQVEAAPARAEGLQSAEGQVRAVSQERVTLESPDGLLEFQVADEARDHIDFVHLEEHMEAGDPVVVYYEKRDDGLYMHDYEDAS